MCRRSTPTTKQAGGQDLPCPIQGETNFATMADTDAKQMAEDAAGMTAPER